MDGERRRRTDSSASVRYCVDEADFIGEDIKSAVRQGGSYNDSAVLYRTNAQSRLLEEKFIAMNIPL